MRVRFCWYTRNPSIIQRISARFKVSGMTINRESTVALNDEEFELLRVCEKKGHVQIREVVK